MRVLAITNLFPNARRPLIAPYNVQQLTALGRLCELRVLATLPWFPGARWMARWTPSGLTCSVPREEHIAGLMVQHPRTLYVPRVPALSGPLFAASLVPHIMRFRGKIDVVFSAWAYPDGCASVALARLLGVSAVIKAHGSDINVFAGLRGVRPYLRRLLPRAARLVAVSRDLGRRLVGLGVAPERVAVIYNGVDSALFRLRDRAEARAALGLSRTGSIILYVGNLLETKGVLDLARAFERIAHATPHTTLIMIGDGAARPACDAVAARVGTQMKLVGPRPLADIGMWMAACDVLALPSWNEGTPNVILEALACGRRVVATPVGGIPDLIESDVLGTLTPVRDPDALATALRDAVSRDYDPATVATAGARGSWAENAAQLRDVLAAAIAAKAPC